MVRETTLWLAVLAVFCSAALALAANSGTKAPETLTLKGPTQPAVSFNHKLHADSLKIPCRNCHHTWQPGQPVRPCEDCHRPQAKPGSRPMPLQDALHKNCLDCHKAQHKGPTRCAQCHRK